MRELEIDTYEEDLPSTPLVPMAPEAIVDLLRSAFHLGQLNQLRALERDQALLAHSKSEPIPLEDYEFYYHKAQLVELLLEGGVPAARQYCDQRQFAPEDSTKLIAEARTFIVACSQEQAVSAKEFALARYNKLFERLYTLRDYKGAAMVQRCIDRLHGFDAPQNEELDLRKGLLSVMQQIAKEEPQPLLPLAKPEKSVFEVNGSHILKEHVVDS